MEIVAPLAVCFLIGIALAVLVTRSLPPDEGAWLLRIVIIAFVLRLAAATLFATVPETRLFHEDATGYETVGAHIADGWAGRTPPYPFFSDLPNRGYFYICAAISYLSGGSRAAPSFINAIIGALTVAFVYRLSRRLFHPLVGRMAAQLTAYTPSMVLWSSIALKDPIMAMLVLLTLDACVDLKRRFTIRGLLGVAIPLVAMQPIRFYMIYFLGFAVVCSLVFERGAGAFAGLPKQILVGGALVGMLALVGLSSSAEQNASDYLNLERVSTFRHGMATSANSGFEATTDISTPARA